MLNLLAFFAFLLVFIRNGSATNNKKIRDLFEPNCDGVFNVSEIAFISPIELFQKVTINIEIYSETNFSVECFFEANLEFRHSLNSLKIFQLGTFSIGRKILRATKRIRMEFECWHFFAPGLYRLSLPSAFITSSSEWIQINPPNLAIQIHLPAVSAIFPFCQNALSISWTLPNCPKIIELLDFRLRLLAPFNELNEDEHMLYLEEFLLVVPNSEDTFLQKSFIGLHQRNIPTNFLRIPCTKFDIIHEQFCFELVSVSKQSQQHQSWDRKCIRTEAQKADVDALWEWSEWSEWAKCFCQRNESSGIRKRTRHCRRSNTNSIERTTVRSLSKVMTKAAFGRRGECRGGQIMQREKCHRRECQRNQAADLPPDLAVSSLGFGQSVRNLTFENPSADDNGTSKCLCGCKLSERPQGMFFASFCPTKNVQQWQLEFGKPFRVQIILTDRLMGEEATMAFEVIRDNGEEKEMVWNSENNPHDESVIIEGVFQKAAIFELKNVIGDNNGDQWQKKRTDFGILVEYKITAFEEIWSAAGGSSTLLQLMRILCSKGPKFANCSALFVFSLLFVLFAVFFPPIVFVFVIKRHTKKKLAKQFGHIYHKNVRDSSALLVSTHCHNQIDSEMIRSADGTESTKLSNCLANSAKRKSPPTEAQRMKRGNGAVGQRSIGIQLSRLSTPRCASRQFPPHRRRPSANHNARKTSADNLSDSIGSATIENNSNLTEDYWNEDDDFGAEQLQLSGRWATELENLSSHFVSDIDIDQTARREASDNNWYFWRSSTVTDRRDASTQKDLNLETQSIQC